MTEHKYFSKNTFVDMQSQQDKIRLPAELGAIPRKLGSNMKHMKADQVHHSARMFSFLHLHAIIGLYEKCT